MVKLVFRNNQWEVKPGMTIRLLAVQNIMSPYNLSFFAALSKVQAVAARTVFLAPNDTNRPRQALPADLGFDYRVLPCLHTFMPRYDMPVYVHWGLWTELRRFHPDVLVISGYHYFATLEVLAFARGHRVPAVLWSGSHLGSGFIKRGWADAYKRWVISRFDAYLTYGSAARDQLVHYGAPPGRIIVGCNTVDVCWFKQRAQALPRADQPAGPLRLLFVGRLVPLKNVGALITAVGRLQQRGLHTTLAIVGDGPAHRSLQQQVDRDGVRGVTFAGFQTAERLVAAYVNADALVLPSLNEVWGVVVNEAAACGIPAVVSTRAGAARDLIRAEETGLTFDPARPGDLEQSLERLARDRGLCRRMGEAAQQFILTRDQAYYVERLVNAAQLALTGHRHHGDRAGPA